MVASPCLVQDSLTLRLAIIGIVLGVATVIVGNLGAVDQQSLYEPGGIYYECCHNVTCTDTYFDNDTNECVLVLCRNTPLQGDFKECRYKPSSVR